MLVQQVDALHSESLERTLDCPLDLLGSATHRRCSRPIIAATQIEPELSGDHHFSTERRQGFAHKLFVQERAVDFGRIKECDAAFYGGTEK